MIKLYRIQWSFLCLAIIQYSNAAGAQTECSWDVQCEELYRRGSKCFSTGQCSNPFREGCLHSHYRSFPKRTCNTDDATDTYCQESPFDYPEIRIHNSNWESSIFYAWIIQVYLSEFLDVPVSVGLSAEDTMASSFYSPIPEISYSSEAYPFEAMTTANSMNSRCDLTDKPCVHVMPEVWIEQEKRWKNYLAAGQIDQVNGGGQVGKISWYLPIYTARRYPELASFHGLSGRRQELANIFKRPTSWGDYCAEISSTNCLVADGVAQRPPDAEAGEDSMYFMEGDYTGFFRATNKNNCTLDNRECSGHIVGAPCTWSTNIDAQTYWNNIALESDGPLEENYGYSYGQMIQIWRAANATKSDVIMWWWVPDPTVEEFRGTDYEFQPVLLPEPTSECRLGRIAPEDRCSLDINARRGEDPRGGCDNESNSLQKVVAASLRDSTYETPEVDRSPGYQAILNLKVSHLDMNTMLKKWVDGDRSGFAAREAVCEWVLDHQEELESYVPRGYPRVFTDNKSHNVPLTYAAMGFGGFAVLYVLMMSGLVYIFSDTKVFVYAQVPFIVQVLVGLLLVAIASIFFAVEPRSPLCVTQMWLLTLGYTLELVPLLVKVAAINRLMAATRRMRRVRISMQSLFLTVAGLVVLVVIFLSIWTALDPPERREGRYLLEEDGFEIVTFVTCASDSGIWDLMVVCWNGLLIICATALAFQSRTIKQEFNDSRSLGIMIYSHFVFGVLRAVTFNLDSAQSTDEQSRSVPAIDSGTLAAASSFLLSLDVITAVTIYVLPKIAAARKSPQTHVSSGTSGQSSMVSSKQMAQGSQDRPGNSTSSRRAGKRLVNGMPSIDELPEEDSLALEEAPPQKTLSHSSGHRRVLMDGNVYTEEEDEEDESSSEADTGGPRFREPNRTDSMSCRSDNGLVEHSGTETDGTPMRIANDGDAS